MCVNYVCCCSQPDENDVISSFDSSLGFRSKKKKKAELYLQWKLGEMSSVEDVPCSTLSSYEYEVILRKMNNDNFFPKFWKIMLTIEFFRGFRLQEIDN